ncbi:MAG: N-acetylglucosamine kinase [Herbinix sp.]|jgi:N-acetylglucosamine kinase-like BadF-type ATPase|nr:N-acetylglucosamine kinase [Herbinix sp.]
METRYIIGVDGGGTKTDYLLFTTEGEFVDSYHVGSRSHEIVSGGFAEVEESVLADLEHLLEKNSISASNIAAAAFGMAGIDTPVQLEQMNQILAKSSLKNYVVANDSVLGIKAGCPSGVGVCSINGTGSVTTGIDEDGKILQVGGIGLATGDHAGGFIIAALAVGAVYDYYYRCGESTVLTQKLMDLFGLTCQEGLYNFISNRFYTERSLDKEIITILFDAANSGDAISVEIVRDIAREQAKSVSGCIRNLKFTNTPEIVLAGSVWTKTNCPILLSYFKECINRYTELQVEPFPLQVIPAVGAIIWSMELALKHPVTPLQRENIIKHMPRV